MSEEREAKSEGGAAPAEGGSAAAEASGAASGGAEGSGGAKDAADAAAEEPRERVDEDGLPLDREATIDDVRSTEARHGRIALGCTLTIVLLVLLFWAIRAGMIG